MPCCVTAASLAKWILLLRLCGSEVFLADVCCLCLFVCLFVCLIVWLFVCVSLFVCLLVLSFFLSLSLLLSLSSLLLLLLMTLVRLVFSSADALDVPLLLQCSRKAMRCPRLAAAGARQQQ